MISLNEFPTLAPDHGRPEDHLPISHELVPYHIGFNLLLSGVSYMGFIRDNPYNSEAWRPNMAGDTTLIGGGVLTRPLPRPSTRTLAH